MTVSRRILVLDGDMEAALTIVRSLSRQGWTVWVAAADKAALCKYSRHCRDLLVHPDPLQDVSGFLDWLVCKASRDQFDLVIPVTERTLAPISNAEHMLEQVSIAMPKRAILDNALDKSKTMALASSVGVRVPTSVELGRGQTVTAPPDGLGFPLVLKPTRSVTSGAESGHQHSVSYTFDEPDYVTSVNSLLCYGDLLVQELFTGTGVGIEILAQDGRVLYAFQHERLHEVPLSGGGSSYRRASALNEDLLDASKRLIEAMEWTGVAMVEFKHNKVTGEFVLMEVNGRFWGSLPLAVHAGADFPAMLVRLLLDGETKFPPEYDHDRHCRKLSRDVSWFEAILRRQYDPRLFAAPSKTNLLLDALGVFRLRHSFDVQELRDPVPGLIDIYRVVRLQTSRVAELFSQRRSLRVFHLDWRAGRVARQMESARSVLFLCYGNINRSATAALLLAHYAEDLGISVLSAGFHKESGRPMDPVMKDVLSKNGVDASRHRSVCVDEQLLQEADVVFLMDLKNEELLSEQFSSFDREKVFLLGAYAPTSSQRQIPDPYGKQSFFYESAYKHVNESVERVKDMLSTQIEG